MFSNDRMNFIIEYISSYEQKIKIANKNGLFDSAKMFELFAQEICGIYFNRKFYNLNDKCCNFPYFDLISEDKKIYVQVSTIADITIKIKKTLEKIRDNKDGKYTGIVEIFFFVLHNDSVTKVKSYSGKNQIGNISFDKDKNLITSQDIIKKSKSDLKFQEEIYTLLKNEFENYNDTAKKFNEAINFSKNAVEKNIEDKINNEYEIDRTILINKIKEDNGKFISIQGLAGSGKTVICKNYVKDEELFLFARAERFIEESNLEKIWNVDIKNVLDFLNGKRIVFFIDALEFIADASETKMDLLDYFYSVVSKYENAYIITSCRSNDKNKFIKIESNYKIKTYEIGEISEEEFKLIKKKYPQIRILSQNSNYESLLKIPFYLNVILSYSIKIDDIEDVNKLRNYIWKNVICLGNCSKKYKLDTSKVKKEVEKIVFTRAKNFSLGINESLIDSKILSVLVSDGIVLNNNGNVRLKFDIFEDICFEQFFDRKFEYYKGKYKDFYKNIEKLGRCIYRRYQIWISNKLFVKDNRDKFIDNLIFSNTISDKWKKQTEIGIVKSKYSDKFFEENKDYIIYNNLLDEFIDVINTYSFDIKIINYNNDLPIIQLNPTGIGRRSIIKIISEEKIYLNTILRKKIEKLCMDYSNEISNEDNIDNSVCLILEHFIDESLKRINSEWFDILDDIKDSLFVLFKLSNSCIPWLNNFFSIILEDYLKNNKRLHRKSENILEWVVENAHFNLVKNLPNVMCSIADALWINRDTKTDLYYHESNESEYGLNDHYKYSYIEVKNNILLWNLFRMNFHIGLDWAINFINKSVDEYAKKRPEDVSKIKLKFIDNDECREYYGNGNMWMANTRDGYIPDLLCDIVYNIKESIIAFVENPLIDNNVKEKLLKDVKDTIYLKANNVILLTIIESLGFHFKNEYPGYALDLVTSIDIVNWDIHRYGLYISNPQRDLLLKQLSLKVGIPELKNRYDLDDTCRIHIVDYVINLQIDFDSIIREKVYKVLDYLYKIVNNDKEHASNYLQIQKMDMRNATITKINNNTLMLEANITGEAKKVVEQHKKENENYIELNETITNYINSKKQENNDIELLIECIEKLMSFLNDDSIVSSGYESILISFISLALKEENLAKEKRETFCKFWIKGIESLFENKVFIFEYSLISVLIEQIYRDISVKLKNNIKQIILDCIINYESDSIIKKIQIEVSKYLKIDSHLSKIMINTIVKLSEDEMNHQKYNACFVNERGFEFVPNMTPKLDGIDNQIENKDKKYESLKNKIIENYLFNEMQLDLTKFDINEYDICLLYKIVHCGISIEFKESEEILKDILICIIEVLNSSKYSDYDIINVYMKFDIINYLQQELVYTNKYSEKLIDFFFKDIDFNNFQMNTIEFYQDIFSGFIAEFYDSYNDKVRRNICKKKILEIEKRVIAVQNEKIKKELYKCLIFNASKDCKWDPSKIKTSYSYDDKAFLNKLYSKYAKHHVRDAFRSIYLLNINELLPEILISINEIISSKEDTISKELNGDVKTIINMIIIKSFTNFSDKIKTDFTLIEAYENILSILIKYNSEIAGVLLDEFRVH